MSLNFKDIVGNIFYTDKKEKTEEEQKSAELKQKTNNVMGTTGNYATNEFNPFVKKNGELVNPYIDYQNVLDNPYISKKAKDYITKATGLTPTATPQTTTQKNNTVAPSTATTTIKTNSSIADAAQKYIGTPYVWGGESLEEGGFDCSGFIHNTLKDAGYNIGRTSAQGYRGYGKVVNKADMQPGDLIFFGSNGNATHVGIYIGNGQMIHSSGGSKNTKANPGKGVSVINVDHRKDFIEARRY